MTDNPLDDDQRRQQRVSERAYHLWKSEGELHGHDQEYWERAEELIGMEDSAGSGQLPNPMSVPGNDPSRPPMVEEASIQENLGEFPGQTDQGDHLHTPSAAASHDHDDVAPLGTPDPTETGRARKSDGPAPTKASAEKKPVASTGKVKAALPTRAKEDAKEPKGTTGKAKSDKSK